MFFDQPLSDYIEEGSLKMECPCSQVKCLGFWFWGVWGLVLLLMYYEKQNQIVYNSDRQFSFVQITIIYASISCSWTLMHAIATNLAILLAIVLIHKLFTDEVQIDHSLAQHPPYPSSVEKPSIAASLWLTI